MSESPPPGAAPWPPATPTTPRPAATVMLLRGGGSHSRAGLEVLMVRRGRGQSFMPGVWVFPGGAIDGGEGAAACAARELREETGIDLPPSTELLPWARWITPEVVPIRFDTHFLVARAPAHAPPRPDGSEVDGAGWFAPRKALDAAAGGEMSLVFPTVKTLETLLPYDTAADALAAARERVVEPILPRVVGTREDHRILLPGDEGYE